MTEKLLVVAFLFGYFTIVSGLFIAGAVVLSRLFEVAVAEAVVGSGISPRLVKFRAGETDVQVGLLPFTCHTTLLDFHNESKYPHINATGRRFSEKPLWQQVVMSLQHPAVLALAAFCILGVTDFSHHAATALPQIVLGALKPLSVGQVLLSKFAIAVVKSPLQAAGILATKLLVLQLLPFFGSPTTIAMSRVAKHLWNIELAGDIGLPLAIVWWFPLLAIWMSWGVAVLDFLLQ
jgi:hypothetical protein